MIKKFKATKLNADSYDYRIEDDYVLCVPFVRRHFKIPKKQLKITIAVSDKPMVGAKKIVVNPHGRSYGFTASIAKSRRNYMYRKAGEMILQTFPLIGVDDVREIYFKVS